MKLQNTNLFPDIRQLIEQSRRNVALAVNAELTILYWNIGNRIKKDVLNNQRAGYGEEIIKKLLRNYLFS